MHGRMQLAVPVPSQPLRLLVDCRLQIYKDIVGTTACRIAVDAPGKTPNTWQRTGVVIDTKDEPELDDRWRRDISQGADHVLQESIITCTDPHYDAASASRSSSRVAHMPFRARFSTLLRTPNYGSICIPMGLEVSAASPALAACIDSRATACS